MAAKIIVFASALVAINAAILPYPRSHFIISTVPREAVPSYTLLQPSSSSASSLAQNGLAASSAQTASAPALVPTYAYYPAQPQPTLSSTLSSAQSSYPAQLQSASAQALKAPGYESAVSSANSLGYGSSLSAAQNAPGYQSAYSTTLGKGAIGNYGASVAAAQNSGAYKSSIAQTVQQSGNNFQNSGAASYSAPGLQVAQSQAINSGRRNVIIY